MTSVGGRSCRWLLPGAAAAALFVGGAPADASQVGLTATAAEPSKCFPPKANKWASTSCQVFAGTPLTFIALASRDDGGAKLMPQPFTLLAGRPGRAFAPLLGFSTLDENDADDTPIVTPLADTDYKVQFGGNPDIGPGESAVLVAQVGARIVMPPASQGRGNRLRIPVGVEVPWPALRGRLELRRCKRTKSYSAASCAKRSSYSIVSRREASATKTVRFSVSAPRRSYRRYEIAFRPRSRLFTVTRAAFTVLNGYDGVTSYRPTVRAAPFGTR